MGKLALIGATLLAFHGGHHRRYWWPATDTCTISAKHIGNTFYVGANHPNVYCTTRAAHWGSKPPPVEQPAG